MENLIEPHTKEGVFPYAYTFDSGIDITSLISWYQDNKEDIERQLLKTGALLIQGANIDTLDKFEQFTGKITSKFRNYLDGNYPRKNLQGHVYISTEYDKNYDITMHNELSYSYKWPSKLLLGCILPSETGGETPLADSRKIVQRMNKDLLVEFETRQIRYIRNLHSGAGMGPSWQETFATQDKKEVEKHCKEINIQYQWKDQDHLTLENIRPATRLHPVTGERVWFNQVDQYHPSHFPKEVYETLILLAEGKEENLPLYVSYGDGGEITEDVVKEVMDTIDKEVVLRTWEKGDFVIVDNMLVAHGRKAYTGDRKVVVAMAQ